MKRHPISAVIVALVGGFDLGGLVLWLLAVR